MSLVPGWKRYPKRHDVVVVPGIGFKGCVERVDGYHRIVSFMDDIDVKELAMIIRSAIEGEYPHRMYCEVIVDVDGESRRFNCLQFFYEESDGEERVDEEVD